MIDENYDCHESANGEHEIDFEKLTYRCHAGTNAATFNIACLHCGALGKITVADDLAKWESRPMGGRQGSGVVGEEGR